MLSIKVSEFTIELSGPIVEAFAFGDEPAKEEKPKRTPRKKAKPKAEPVNDPDVDKDWDLEAMRALLQNKASEIGDRPRVKAVLTDFGVQNLDELDPSKYADLAKAVGDLS